jgi:hypothetical protein
MGLAFQASHDFGLPLARIPEPTTFMDYGLRRCRLAGPALAACL